MPPKKRVGRPCGKKPKKVTKKSGAIPIVVLEWLNDPKNYDAYAKDLIDNPKEADRIRLNHFEKKLYGNKKNLEEMLVNKQLKILRQYGKDVNVSKIKSPKKTKKA